MALVVDRPTQRLCVHFIQHVTTNDSLIPLTSTLSGVPLSGSYDLIVPEVSSIHDGYYIISKVTVEQEWFHCKSTIQVLPCIGSETLCQCREHAPMRVS